MLHGRRALFKICQRMAAGQKSGKATASLLAHAIVRFFVGPSTTFAVMSRKESAGRSEAAPFENCRCGRRDAEVIDLSWFVVRKLQVRRGEGEGGRLGKSSAPSAGPIDKMHSAKPKSEPPRCVTQRLSARSLRPRKHLSLCQRSACRAHS